jgi:NDP-4-keto-2,6-dideoxyhexose 3-C-methyltransferase
MAQELLNLGNLYVSDFLKPEESPRTGKHELKLVLDADGAARLEKMAPKETMWGDRYWYRSGTNKSMTDALKDVVDSVTNIYKLNQEDVWVDIASNDLTLLGFVPKNLIRVGIDPIKDPTFLLNKNTNTNLVIQDYFSAKVFKESKYGNKKAKVITCISCFYDIENNNKFLQDIYDVLDDDGLFVLQFSYTPLMIKQLAFDNLCHEHCYYYSLVNLKKIFERNNFTIMDCVLNDVNAGSARIYLMKNSGNKKYFSTQPFRDVAQFRVDSLLEYEKTLQLDSAETWENFKKEIDLLKNKLTYFLKEEKAKGKIVYGYGASTKFNTTLQYFGLDNTFITKIADRSPAKWGLRTVGTNIPICSEDDMRQDKPDYLLIGPWHFISEFIEREKEYLDGGGKFIVPAPCFEIIGK